MTDAMIQSHSLDNLSDIGLYFVANIGDRIRKGNFHRQEGVRGVLDHFRRGDIGDDHRALQRSVEFQNLHSDDLVWGANDDAVRMQGILNRRAFPQEFGVRDNIEIHIAAPVRLDNVTHKVTRANRDGGLIHDDLVAIHRCGNASRRAFNL